MEKQKILKTFCEETAIHGLRFINGLHVRHLYDKLIWSTIFMAMLVIAVWQCSLNIKTYLHYDVKISLKYERSNEGAKFPAITMCNANFFKKSIVGHYPALLAMLSSFFVENTSDDLKKMINLNVKTCNISDNSRSAIDLSDPVAYLDEHKIDGFLVSVGHSSNISVEKLWWDNKEIESRKHITELGTDRGACFTINLPKVESELITTIVGPIVGNPYLNDYYLNSTKFGPQSGLRLLINVHASEYCGTFRHWQGVGFITFIHDQTDDSIMKEVNEIRMYPGKSYNVALEPIRYNRKTEFMGRCRSTMILPNTKITGPYIVGHCKMLCYVKHIITKCNCLPIFLENNIENINKLFATNLSTCSFVDNCFGVEGQIFDQFTAQICTECVPQCSVMAYEYTVTESNFPSINHRKRIASDFQVQYNKSNSFVVNMYFSTSTRQTITELQKFTMIDLLTFFGGNIGLFLGMSLISIFELFHPIVILIHVKILQLLNFFKNPLLAKGKRRNAVISSTQQGETMKGLRKMKPATVFPAKK